MMMVVVIALSLAPLTPIFSLSILISFMKLFLFLFSYYSCCAGDVVDVAVMMTVLLFYVYLLELLFFFLTKFKQLKERIKYVYKCTYICIKYTYM